MLHICMPIPNIDRIFKSAWFSKAARKARIADRELCDAVAQVVNGQAVDLGGGVFKNRLNKNEHRAIILSRGSGFWMYEFLLAKKDMENISEAELAAFRKLAKAYSGLTAAQVLQLLKIKDWIEICQEIE